MARGPHRRDETHILSKVSGFLLKSFHFCRLQKRQFFFPYRSLYFECYATMPMLADAHISSLGNLCFFSLISEEEGEPWDEDAQQKRQSSLRKISSPLAPQDGLTLRLLLGGLKKVKFSQGYVKGNYVGDPSGTFHVRMGQYEG